MNLVGLFVESKKKLISAFLQFVFYIKKNIYNISFNSQGNIFSFKGIMRGGSISIEGWNNRLIVEDCVRLINTRISIKGNNNCIYIHKGVVFSEGGRIRIEDDGSRLEIGDNSTMINVFFSLAESTKLLIGRDCLFSADVVVRTSDSHSIIDCLDETRLNCGKDVIIGDNVWIANGVSVLKGSEIGNWNIVGTHSVVSKIVTSKNCLVVGNPARVVKTNVKWKYERL